MGLFTKTEWQTETVYVNNSPDPTKFKILRTFGVGSLTVAEIKYPGCTNYEGRKILILNIPEESVLIMKRIDPHFERNGNVLARFEPTEIGYSRAIIMAGIIYNSQGEKQWT